MKPSLVAFAKPCLLASVQPTARLNLPEIRGLKSQDWWICWEDRRSTSGLECFKVLVIDAILILVGSLEHEFCVVICWEFHNPT